MGDNKFAILMIALYFVAVKSIWKAFCPMLIFTGLPCPGCGMTRAVLYLLQGQWTRSFNLHPAAALWVLFVAWCVLWRYLLGKKIKWLTGLLAIAIAVTLMVYLYRMIVMFPAYPPMVYKRDNILSGFIPRYKEMIHFIFEMW